MREFIFFFFLYIYFFIAAIAIVTHVFLVFSLREALKKGNKLMHFFRYFFYMQLFEI